jgi:hypothetical protein
MHFGGLGWWIGGLMDWQIGGVDDIDGVDDADSVDAG